MKPARIPFPPLTIALAFIAIVNAHATDNQISRGLNGQYAVLSTAGSEARALNEQFPHRLKRKVTATHTTARLNNIVIERRMHSAQSPSPAAVPSSAAAGNLNREQSQQLNDWLQSAMNAIGEAKPLLDAVAPPAAAPPSATVSTPGVTIR